MEVTSGWDCTLDDVIDDIENAIFNDLFDTNFSIHGKILKSWGQKVRLPKGHKPIAKKKPMMIEDDLELELENI